MKVLFIHQNFPGQFRHVAGHLAKSGKAEVVAIGHRDAPGMDGVKLIRYELHREPTQGVHHYVAGFERGVLYAQAVARVLHKLEKSGFVPDVVVAHPGCGESLLVKEVFPAARLIHFCEFYYHTEGADANFDPEFPQRFDDRARIRTRNALHLLNLDLSDIGVSPTQWQRTLHPAAYRHKIHVAHEGIDTELLQPDPTAKVTLADGLEFAAGDEVITYVARNLEPYRGFHVFMRTLPSLLAERPNAHVIVVGGNDVSYGSKPRDAKNWRDKMLAEVDVDTTRVHFTGKLPYDTYRKILQVSAVHVYLTYPFVLSWSMLEAMACGCLVIASATPPVQEVIKDGENGLLVDFFDTPAMAAKIGWALESRQSLKAIRARARSDVIERYSLAQGLRRYMELIGISDGDSAA